MLSSPAFKVETCAKFVSQNVWVGAAEGVGSDTNTVPQTWKMVQSEQFCLISWKITYPGTTKSYITEVYAMRNVSGVTRNSLPILPGN